MIKFKKGERRKIKQMQKMFEKIDILYDSLSDQTKEVILDYHNENYTLAYCIRWGNSACEELLDKNAGPYMIDKM